MLVLIEWGGVSYQDPIFLPKDSKKWQPKVHGQHQLKDCVLPLTSTDKTVNTSWCSWTDPESSTFHCPKKNDSSTRRTTQLPSIIRDRCHVKRGGKKVLLVWSPNWSAKLIWSTQIVNQFSNRPLIASNNCKITRHTILIFMKLSLLLVCLLRWSLKLEVAAHIEVDEINSYYVLSKFKFKLL